MTSLLVSLAFFATLFSLSLYACYRFTYLARIEKALKDNFIAPYKDYHLKYLTVSIFTAAAEILAVMTASRLSNAIFKFFNIKSTAFVVATLLIFIILFTVIVFLIIHFAEKAGDKEGLRRVEIHEL